MDDSMIDLADTALRLGVPLRRVRWWAQSGVLPAFRIGGKYYLYKEDLESWLRTQLNSQQPVPPVS